MKRVAATKSTNGFPDSWHWALSNNKPTTGFLWDGWLISCYPSEIAGLQHAMLCASEGDAYFIGGLFFADHSTTAMNSDPGCPWPSIVNHGYPMPESDYIISYLPLSIGEMIFLLGPEYSEGHKLHYVFTYEGSPSLGSYGLANPYNYCVSSFYTGD